MSIFFQKIEADERVHDRAQAARRCASFLAQLLDGLRSARQRVKDFIADGCTDDEWRGVGETKLHQTFRSDLIFHGSFHGRSTITQRVFAGKSESTFAKSG